MFTRLRLFFLKRRAKRSFYHLLAAWKRAAPTLPERTASEGRMLLTALHKELFLTRKEVVTSTVLSASIASLIAWSKNALPRRGLFKSLFEFSLALLLAILAAIVVRQSWFELYEIPTGSMRPTFEEQDRLIVSKTAFALNIPTTLHQLFFSEKRVNRTEIVVWSGENIPYVDKETTYFGVFPTKKRYVKRCIGKPGDSLYFYGGKIYGVDRNGNPLHELLSAPWMEKLEHIPYISFEGEITSSDGKNLILRQMGKSIGRLLLNNRGEVIQGEFLDPLQNRWKLDDPLTAEISSSAQPHVDSYADFFGIANVAMARLLTEKELLARDDLRTLREPLIGQGILYLELKHTPSLTTPRPRLLLVKDRFVLDIPGHTTLLPIQQEQIDRLAQALYTARFIVQNGRASRYSSEGTFFPPDAPQLYDVPDGTYEFYYGNGFQIGWGGIAHQLEENSPLLSRSPERLQWLFNLGIELNAEYSPSPTGGWTPFPHRYATFRDGNLYLMGAPIFFRDEPILQTFVQRENQRAAKSSALRPYAPFTDHGPPLLKDGRYDVDFIRTFGVTIPDHQYLLLGDNHAMSADSRTFGMVPQENLQGTPTRILWPPGPRWGALPQPAHPWITFPRAVVWALAAAIFLLCWKIQQRRRKRLVKHLLAD